jgi:hypothetical protein
MILLRIQQYNNHHTMIDIADPRVPQNIRVKLNAVIQNESSPRTLKGDFKLHHQRSHHQQSHKRNGKTRGS